MTRKLTHEKSKNRKLTFANLYFGECQDTWALMREKSNKNLVVAATGAYAKMQTGRKTL